MIVFFLINVVFFLHPASGTESSHFRQFEASDIDVPANIPAFFDARETWPACSSIRKIRDQSNCNSGWAFATVGAISDRICIVSKQRSIVQISAQELISCCSDCGHGCDGGFVGAAWEYFVNEGLVTGGPFNGSGCQPYSIPPDQHSANNSETPVCERVCLDGKDFTMNKHYGLNSYPISGEQRIQAEIMQNGPVAAYFTVYSDFLNYTSGIYQKRSHDIVTGHAVKLVGWGEEAGVPFWTAANSWSTDWGEAGFFRIARGSNECGIESGAAAGIPDV